MLSAKRAGGLLNLFQNHALARGYSADRAVNCSALALHQLRGTSVGESSLANRFYKVKAAHFPLREKRAVSLSKCGCNSTPNGDCFRGSIRSNSSIALRHTNDFLNNETSCLLFTKRHIIGYSTKCIARIIFEDESPFVPMNGHRGFGVWTHNERPAM